MGNNPLIGELDYFHGFVDPNDVLKKLNSRLESLKFSNLYSSIYVAVPGPVFETKPEADKFAKNANLIGMSTVPELIAIAQQGGNALALSLVTNIVAPERGQVTHEENLRIVSEKDGNFSILIHRFIASFK